MSKPVVPDACYPLSFAFFSSGFGPPARRLTKRWSVSNQKAHRRMQRSRSRSQPRIMGGSAESTRCFRVASGQPMGRPVSRSSSEVLRHPGPGVRYDHEIAMRALRRARSSRPGMRRRRSGKSAGVGDRRLRACFGRVAPDDEVVPGGRRRHGGGFLRLQSRLSSPRPSSRIVAAVRSQAMCRASISSKFSQSSEK